MIERAELIDRHCSRVPIPASDGLSRNSDLLARVDWKLEDGDTFTAHAGVPEAKKESIVHRSTTTESSMILHDRSGALVTILAATAYLPVHAIDVRLLAFSGRTYAGNPHLAAALPTGAAVSLLDHDDRCHDF